MEKSFLNEVLICPDCKSRLDLEKMKCAKCSYIIKESNGIIRLLPSKIESNKVNEDQKWENPEFLDKKNTPAWFSLVVKAEDVFYLHHKILPNYKFKGRVLEIGSGTCWISSCVKTQYPDVEIVASDVSINAMSRGREIEKIVGGKIDHFVNCDVESLPFADETFDVVFGSSIVHHLANPYKGVSEIFRVLKKDSFYLSILELEANRVLGYIWQRIGAAGELEHKYGIQENVYNFRQYRSFFKSAGFKQIKFFLERDPKYKHHHWFLGMYYKIMSYFPDWIPKLIGSSIGFVAFK